MSHVIEYQKHGLPQGDHPVHLILAILNVNAKLLSPTLESTCCPYIDFTSSPHEKKQTYKTEQVRNCVHFITWIYESLR